jgi:hypothetical protein
MFALPTIAVNELGGYEKSRCGKLPYLTSRLEDSGPCNQWIPIPETIGRRPLLELLKHINADFAQQLIQANISLQDATVFVPRVSSGQLLPHDSLLQYIFDNKLIIETNRDSCFVLKSRSLYKDSLVVSTNSLTGDCRVNGIKIYNPNILAINGVVHVIAKEL